MFHVSRQEVNRHTLLQWWMKLVGLFLNKNTHAHTRGSLQYPDSHQRLEMCVRVSVTPRCFQALPRQSAALTAFVHDTFSLLFPSVKLPSLATTRKSCHDMPRWDCVLCIVPGKTLLSAVKWPRPWTLRSEFNPKWHFVRDELISVSKWKHLVTRCCHTSKSTIEPGNMVLTNQKSSKAVQFGGELTETYKTSPSSVL